MNKIFVWIRNARHTALVQSVMPSILAAVLAIGYPGFNIWMTFLAVLGVACAHLALNLTDDYFDYKADMLSDRDRVVRNGFRAMMVKYPYLTDGSQTIGSLRVAIASFSAVACLCGAIIFLYRFMQHGLWGPCGTWQIIALVAVTALLGVFYSAPPIKLAYHGLGELVIGFIFGPLLMSGVYYSSCAQAGSLMWWVSLPVGLLVLNILFTHSYIEREGDSESNKITLALLLGSDRANFAASCVINLMPFVIVAAAVILGQAHPAFLAVLLVLPRSLWLLLSLSDFSHGKIDMPSKPPVWLGPMPHWPEICSLHIDWFMARWLTSRNILSGFCLIVIVVKLILHYFLT